MPRFDKGLGGWRPAGVLMGLDRDLSGLELTPRLAFAPPIRGAFGAEIGDLTLPVPFSMGIEANALTETIPEENGWRLNTGAAEFFYDHLGCRKLSRQN